MGVEAVHRAGQLASGIWGEHSASIDWCEDNYAVSLYLAEFWNTLSNIPFILLGLHGILYSKGLPHQTRYALLQGGIAAIGIGSFIFHATLKWHAQVMLDELPMIFVSSLALYALVADDVATKDLNKRLFVKFALATIPVTVSLAYLAYPDPLLHQVCYAVIQIASTIRVRFMYHAKQLTPAAVNHAKWLMNSGTVVFVLGFLVWNLDNMYCDDLTSWRQSVGGYVGWMSQGHAVWHLLTGLGASRIVVGIIYLTLSINYPGEYEIDHSLAFLPYVKAKKQVSRKQL